MWAKLETFYHIVKAGSLVGAAKVLKTDQPTLSSKLATLERNFGFKLINRSTPHKPLSLTRKGEEVFKVAEQTFVLIREMNTRLYDDDKIEGKIRLSTTNAIADYVVGPVLIDFAQDYPEIEVELLCNDSHLDVISNEVDLAIRPYVKDDPILVQEHLFTLEAGLYASPEYLKKFGEPKSAEDLDNHRLLTFARGEENPYSQVDWPLTIGRFNKKKRKAFYTSNSVNNLLEAAERGLGIVPFYDFMEKARKSNLVRVLKDTEGPIYEEYIVLPKNLQDSKRLGVIKDYISKKISKI